MNIRKNIDYTDLYEALDGLMARQLPQMELYCGSERPYAGERKRVLQ